MTDNFDRIWKVSEEDILAVVWDDTEIFSQQHCEEVLLCRSLIPPGHPKAHWHSCWRRATPVCYGVDDPRMSLPSLRS